MPPYISIKGPPPGPIDSVEEFVAHAHALETEASERYHDLADSMEVHNNHEVANLFRHLAQAGEKHAAHMLTFLRGREMPHIAPWDFKWGDGESPEMAPLSGVHYLMTPYHALDLARSVETSARQFYSTVSETTSDNEVRSLAGECAVEEGEHVDMIDQWIARYPQPEDGWDYDPDPPVSIE